LRDREARGLLAGKEGIARTPRAGKKRGKFQSSLGSPSPWQAQSPQAQGPWPAAEARPPVQDQDSTTAKKRPVQAQPLPRSLQVLPWSLPILSSLCSLVQCRLGHMVTPSRPVLRRHGRQVRQKREKRETGAATRTCETAARGTGAADTEQRARGARSAELELGIACFPRRRLACRARYMAIGEGFCRGR
jgi:hypothetical protein